MKGLHQPSGSRQIGQDRQMQQLVDTLCLSPSKARNQGPTPACRLHLRPGRVVASENGPKLSDSFQVSFFLIQHLHGCLSDLTVFQNCDIVGFDSFCLFFFFFPMEGECFGAVNSTILLQLHPFLLLSISKFHRVSTKLTGFLLLSHSYGYIHSHIHIYIQTYVCIYVHIYVYGQI